MEKRMEFLEQKEGIRFIVNSMLGNKIVPIIGAGFTAGCEACAGSVPDGKALEDIMKKIIKKHSEAYRDVVDNYSFKDLSDIFFDTDEVPTSVSLDVLKNVFTKVKLPQYKIDFLYCWRYIYTINIDDAIENNTDFSPILPYTSLREESICIIKRNKYVLKLHGDANHEIIYSRAHNIVFSSDQYISSLRHPDNEKIINSVYSDYKQKNILFIGCSLNDEPDLKVIYNDVKNDIHGSRIMQLRRSRPDDISLRKLKKHGINTIILVDNYDVFYKELVFAYKEAMAQFATSTYKYKNPKTDIISDRKNILTSISIGRNPFPEKIGIFKIPVLAIKRDIVDNILYELDKEHFFVIQGRRFSGKTYLINYITQHAPAYDKFLFPSNISFDDSFIENLLEKTNNSIFIFDSNAMTPEIYTLILIKKQVIVEHHNKIVVVSNTNEDFLILKLKARYYHLTNTFTGDELDVFNEKADKLAFIRAIQL